MATTAWSSSRKLAYGATHRGDRSYSLDSIRVGFDLPEGGDAGGAESDRQDTEYLG